MEYLHNLAAKYLNNQKLTLNGIPLSFKPFGDASIQVFSDGKDSVFKADDSKAVKEILNDYLSCFVFVIISVNSAESGTQSLFIRLCPKLKECTEGKSKNPEIA